MNELTVKEFANLPATIEGLTKFVLFGREKIKSVRAEIRAIDQLGLATDVREQKLAEAQMLSGALLDAERKIGEFTLKMPTNVGVGRWNKERQRQTEQDTKETGEHQQPTGGPLIKDKKDRIKELGLNRRQVQRFEVLAKNPEVVEQVKREAQENDDIPTRSRVLQLVKEKRSPDWRHEARRGINDAIFKPLNARTDDERLSVWFESLTASDEPQWRLSDIDAAINNLYIIRNYLNRRLREG